MPPISRVPAGEAQLKWKRCSTNWCDGVQLPASSLTQVVLVAEPPPPQASSPVCVWSHRDSGRSGREHQGEPSLCRSSTEVQTLPSGCPFRGCPPVTIIAALLLTHNVMVHGTLNLLKMPIPKSEFICWVVVTVVVDVDTVKVDSGFTEAGRR